MARDGVRQTFPSPEPSCDVPRRSQRGDIARTICMVMLCTLLANSLATAQVPSQSLQSTTPSTQITTTPTPPPTTTTSSPTTTTSKPTTTTATATTTSSPPTTSQSSTTQNARSGGWSTTAVSTSEESGSTDKTTDREETTQVTQSPTDSTTSRPTTEKNNSTGNFPQSQGDAGSSQNGTGGFSSILLALLAVGGFLLVGFVGTIAGWKYRDKIVSGLAGAMKNISLGSWMSVS